MSELPEDIESPGPIQLMVVAFPGNQFKGEILPALERLKHDGIVRVLDLLAVRKDPDGNVMVLTATDLGWEEATAFGAYLGSLAGLAVGGVQGMERGAIAGAAALADGHIFDDDDIFMVTQSLPNETTAALVLFEHTWAKPFLDTVAQAEGMELLNTWVRPEKLLEMGPVPPLNRDTTAEST